MIRERDAFIIITTTTIIIIPSSSVFLSHHIQITTHLSSTYIFHHYHHQKFYSLLSNPPYHRSFHHHHHHHHLYLHLISLTHCGSDVLQCLLSDFTVMFQIKILQTTRNHLHISNAIYTYIHHISFMIINGQRLCLL